VRETQRRHLKSGLSRKGEDECRHREEGMGHSDHSPEFILLGVQWASRVDMKDFFIKSESASPNISSNTFL
jgi:hypothetical protein